MARTFYSDVEIQGDLQIGSFSQNANRTVTLASTGAGGTLKQRFSFGSAAVFDIGLVYDTSPSVIGYALFDSDYDFSFRFSGTEVLSITGTGLNLYGAGKFYTGDFSDATPSNRTAVSTNVTNGNTYMTIVPNGTASTAGMIAHNDSDVNNSAYAYFLINDTAAFFNSAKLGTGTVLPMKFLTDSAERMHITTTGSIGFGTTPSIGTPSVSHALIAPNGIIGSNGGTLRMCENISYSSSNWTYIGTAAAGIWQITAGVTNYWTAPSGTGGTTATLTKAFEIESTKLTSLVPAVVSGGCVQVTGSNTPANGGGTEIHYLASEGYVQALDRNGTVWKVMNIGGSVLNFKTNNTIGLIVDTNQSVRAGVASLATTATNGFLYIPSCAGTPTGTPTAVTGMAPMVVDSTNNKLYVYIGGSWQVMN